MSTSTGRRLDVIETALTPREAMLAWMAEAHAFGSLQVYMASLKDAPDEAFPLLRLGRQMEASVRRSRQGQPRDQVWTAVRMAVRDAGFLYYLFSQCNFRVLEQRRANWLHIALVAEMLRTAIERESEAQLALWWREAEKAAVTSYVQQGAVDSIAQRYFDGRNPLFPEIAESVAAQVKTIEWVIGIFNEVFEIPAKPRSKRRKGPTDPPQLDLVDLREGATSAIEQEVALIVALAKAEAWRLIGEREKASELMAPFVWPPLPG